MATKEWGSERQQVVNIADGATESDVLDMRVGKRSTTNILIQGPSAAFTGTITIQVSGVGTSGPWATLQSAGVDVEINTAVGGIGKAVMLDPLTAAALKFVSSAGGGEVGIKTFIVRGDTRE